MMRSVLTMAALLAACSGAVAQVAPETANPPERDAVRGVARFFRDGFPFLDVRRDAKSGCWSAASLAAGEAWGASEGGAARSGALGALRAKVPTVRVDVHGLLGTPDCVRSTEEFLTGAAPGRDAAEVVAGFVRAYAGLFGIEGGELSAGGLVRDYRTAHNGVRHLSWQQRVDGVDIFEAQLHANVMADGRLINIGSTMITRPVGGFEVTKGALSAEEAIARCAADVALGLKGAPVARGAAKGAEELREWDVPGLRAGEPAETRRVYFPMTRAELRAAWEVLLPTPAGPGHTYTMIVDAVDGRVLYRENHLKYATTQPITFRVYTSDSPAPGTPGPSTPNGFQAPFVERQLVTVTPAQMSVYSPNGWINDGGTETLGNNVDAHLDVNSDNQPDLPRPDGGVDRVFDFALDLSQEPSAGGAAAVTQLFYLGNVYHDRLYAMGFDEAAGNFQAVNFGGVGAGNDRVSADAQDGGGTNNANWSSQGTDGSTARTQMYVFNGPTPDRDGSLDADLVNHEFTHGLSIRLHRGRLNMQEQEGGMGEGWSDFFAMCMSAEPGDDFNGVYAMSAYATLQMGLFYNNNYYFGIRRFPYSTDMSKNPLTYADVDALQNAYPPGVARNTLVINTPGEVHNVGEAWCMTLLECREYLSRSMGFAANEEIMQLAVDGMKLAVASELTFVNERDALLQADLVNNGGANFTPLWRAFGKRGVGADAASASSATTGVVESFELPFRVVYTFPQGWPERLRSGETTVVPVDLSPVGLTMVDGTAQQHVRVNGGAVVSTALERVAGSLYRAVLPAGACRDVVECWFSVGTSDGVRVYPAGAPASVLRSGVFDVINVVASDDFETDTGWTVGPDTALLGRWVRVDPVGTEAQPEDDTSPGAGVRCWVTGQGAPGGLVGAADVDGGATVLVSPRYDLSGMADATVSYSRWYDNSRTSAAPGADVFTVQVSADDGATWTTAEVVGPTGPQAGGGWLRAEWSLSDVGVVPTSQVRVRFIAEDAGAGSVVEAAVDDVVVVYRDCGAGPGCASDVNGDGGVDADDVIFFFAGWDAGVGDFNGDGGTDADDVIAFFGAWDAGC